MFFISEFYFCRFLQKEESDKEDQKTLKIKKDLDLDILIIDINYKISKELAACKLPAWYLPTQRTCIAGLCSIIRYALRMGYACEKIQTCQTLLGFQQVGVVIYLSFFLSVY